MEDDTFLFNDLGFCGCGTPEETAVWLRDVLRTMDGASFASEQNMEKRKELVGYGPRGFFILYQLDCLDLTEHGCSVTASWLSPKGKEVLKKLELYTAEKGA